jgi:SAM-dependent methyltransferase
VTKLELPYPPLELANRVGSLGDATEPMEYYGRLGRETRDGIMACLPSDWTFSGKRILDFGCGAGRTLRHFTAEAAEAELWGCDIDEDSVRWMQERMCPPFHVFVNGPEPPLDQPDSSFDLIWAISVFTHLTSGWSRWLVELHRLLKPDALLFVTFMGQGMSQEIAGEPWEENKFGMNVIKYGQSWDLGGPMVLHSPWWIEAHWGRAFEILSLTPDGFAGKPWLDHGSVLMRKRDQTIDPEELERIVPGDARETSSLVHNVEQLHRESLDLRTALSYQLDENVQQKGLLATQSSDLEAKASELEAKASELKAKASELKAKASELKAKTAELNRVRDEADALRREAADLHRKTTVAQQEADAARERSLNSAQRLLAVEENLAQSKARIFALEEAIDELKPKLERADRVMAAMKSSISWRITAPLRALKRQR